ncbi:MAG: glycogen synthase GlgA [Candidatus Sumerlaeia bacterium]
MTPPVQILFATPEVAPFAKTGGLGDVAHALPKALHALGADVRIIAPKYKSVAQAGAPLRLLLPEVRAQLHDRIYYAAVYESLLPGSEVPVYLIENNYFYDRTQLYSENGRDYPDNALRFAFFCQAALWVCKGLGWRPDVIHCNDWQTALIPTYLHHLPAFTVDPFFDRIGVLFTIHNIGYQGLISKDWMPRLSLPWDTFTPQGLEFFDQVNLMKAGLVYSNLISTVSKTYAKEIQTPEFGGGLDGVLRARANALFGILNGIDTHEWNPKTDRYLAAPYDEHSLEAKAINKAALQKRLKLPVRSDVPLLGIVSRLVTHKGLDILLQAMDDILKLGAQLVILGSGDPQYEQRLSELAARHPERLAVHIGFDNSLAHQIEAGADIFLMPSYYEPCGLNQMYSMRYGTPPVVRKTGGLADTVFNASPATIKSGRATGFVFTSYTPRALTNAVQKALKTWRNEPDLWRQLQRNGMRRDFSWTQSALQYLKLYSSLRPS